jgi:hypothetical protein
MSVHVSKMTGKLEGFRSISSNTITNNFCIKMNKANKETICTHCYSHSMLNTYRKNMQNALQRNSDLLSEQLLDADEIPEFKHGEAVRFNAHGELINLTHLMNLDTIVRANPLSVFTLWTKRKDLINKYYSIHDIPVNFILIYSNPYLNKVMSEPPKYFDKTFNNVTSHPDENCTGQKCKDCMMCYTIGDPTKTIIEKVK